MIAAFVNCVVGLVLTHIQVEVKLLGQHVVLLVVDGVDVDPNFIVLIAARVGIQDVLFLSS